MLVVKHRACVIASLHFELNNIFDDNHSIFSLLQTSVISSVGLFVPCKYKTIPHSTSRGEVQLDKQNEKQHKSSIIRLNKEESDFRYLEESF